MLTLRVIENKDYDLLCGWWKSYEWTPPPKDLLPDCGMICYDGETPVCAAYLYVTNSSCSWLEWVISNKDYQNKKNKVFALNLCLESLVNIARKSGFKYIYTVLKHEGLAKMYESLGFVEGDTNIKTFIKTL